MRKRLTFLLVSMMMIACTQSAETAYSTDSERVFLKITANTTKSELTAIATEFKAQKNIDIDFSQSIFDDSGTIDKLYLKVDCNDGYVGVAESSAQVLKSKNSGFARNYAEHTKTPFIIGAM